MNKFQVKNGGGARDTGGFTLLELLLVIGVAALLLIGGIATYRLVSDGNKTTESTRMLLTIRQEAQTLAQQQGGNYTGIAFDSTAGSGDANGGQSPLVTGGVLRVNQRNPFNGAIAIAPTGASNEQLTVSFAGISQSACGKMVIAINNPNEIVSVSVNGGSAITTFPITAATASTACNTSSNTVMWTLP